MKLWIFLDVCFNHYKVEVILTTQIIKCGNLGKNKKHPENMELHGYNIQLILKLGF
jgi:hypothetical protein